MPKQQPQQSGPLTDQHLKILDKVLVACKETEAYCEKCSRCDLDVDAELKKTREQIAIATKIKREFFPQAK